MPRYREVQHNPLARCRANRIPGTGMQQGRRYGSHNLFGAPRISFPFPLAELRERFRGAGAWKRKGTGDVAAEHLQHSLTSAAAA